MRRSGRDQLLDRTVLARRPVHGARPGLTAAQMGLVFSAFRSYAALQIPGGIFRPLRTRLTYSSPWSSGRSSPLMAATRSLGGLILTRIGVGVRGAVLSRQQPHPRHVVPAARAARANGIYSFGQYVGLRVLSVPLFLITQNFGWRGLL